MGALQTLPDVASLLASGGDLRIVPDPATGLTMYGCSSTPDPQLVALGSSTASSISSRGLAAAEALRQRCIAQLQGKPQATVYAQQMALLRAELLELLGVLPAEEVNMVFAASGTDLYMLVTQWLKPGRIVMVEKNETGSGLPAALQGEHFNAQSAHGGAVALGEKVGEWHGDLCMLSARLLDGCVRQASSVDAEYAERVNEAAQAGQHVLMILTDVSKTGLIFPSVATVLALKERWGERVDVLVDACQFRLSISSIQAYLAHGCMLAVTGSKFFCGPTFSGALLIPSTVSARYRGSALNPGVCAYSNAGDWPADWAASLHLPARANFGLLLRWEAAMAEIRAFQAIPANHIALFLERFQGVISARLQSDACFEAVSVPTLNRAALGLGPDWDAHQTIFPFILYRLSGEGAPIALSRIEAHQVYKKLSHPEQHWSGRRFQLGQPVPCGDRAGEPVSALRLCVSAQMIVAAQDATGANNIIADAIAALDQIALILRTD
jgi:hypothetical protein